MKYKTSEAIAMLEKNPRAKLTTTLGGNKYELLVDGKNNNYFVFNVYTKNGEKISSSIGGGGFNYNIPTDLKWELIQQPVDFLTAVKAYSEGKTIRCEIGNNEPSFYSREVAISVLTGKKIYGSTCLIDNHGGTITTEEILEGTWYVEDSYENH
jgi:hypothetical protein